MSKCHHAPARRAVNASRPGNAKCSRVTSWANSKSLGGGRPRPAGGRTGTEDERQGSPGHRFREGQGAQLSENSDTALPGRQGAGQPRARGPSQPHPRPKAVLSWAQELGGVSRRHQPLPEPRAPCGSARDWHTGSRHLAHRASHGDGPQSRQDEGARMEDTRPCPRPPGGLK